MNKKQFCTLLENELRLYLSSKEVYKTLNFFKEMIDDRVDEGLSEEEAVSQLGNIDDIVGQIFEWLLWDHDFSRDGPDLLPQSLSQ